MDILERLGMNESSNSSFLLTDGGICFNWVTWIVFYLCFSVGKFDIDLTSKKSSIKLMIQDELNKIADEEEEEGAEKEKAGGGGGEEVKA